MGVKRIFSKVLIIVFSLGLLAGIVWVLDFFAVLNVYRTVQKIPVVGKMLPVKDEGKSKQAGQVVLSPLETENKKLAGEIEKLKKNAGDLEKRLEVANKEKQSLLEAKNSLQTTLDSLQAWKDQQEGTKLSYEKLAKYYAEMKPDAAVRIMSNLSDEVNIGILQNLGDEQAAKILSAMDPGKAAGIIDKMKR